jgi:hypothetical protein
MTCGCYLTFLSVCTGCMRQHQCRNIQGRIKMGALGLRVWRWMDGWMDRWGSGSTSWWYNTVEGVDKDDGVGVNEYLGMETRGNETAWERKRNSLVVASDNDVSPSASIRIYPFLMVLNLTRLSNMSTFKWHTFICPHINCVGHISLHIRLPQIWSQSNSTRVSFLNVVKLKSQIVSPLTCHSWTVIMMTSHVSYTAPRMFIFYCGHINSACHAGTYTFLFRYINCTVHFDDNCNDNDDVLMEIDW